MKDTLAYILSKLVDHPDDIVIEEATEEGRTTFVVRANPEDMGKIIGKNGRIIRAVRDLIKLMATKHNAYVDVVLAE
jgi:hypothetical protein